MHQSIVAPSNVEGVAVCEKGAAAKHLHAVSHGLGKIGPKKGQVAGLAKVELDGHKSVVKIDLLNACGQHEFVHFIQQAGAD